MFYICLCVINSFFFSSYFFATKINFSWIKMSTNTVKVLTFSFLLHLSCASYLLVKLTSPESTGNHFKKGPKFMTLGNWSTNSVDWTTKFQISSNWTDFWLIPTLACWLDQHCLDSLILLLLLLLLPWSGYLGYIDGSRCIPLCKQDH